MDKLQGLLFSICALAVLIAGALVYLHTSVPVVATEVEQKPQLTEEQKKIAWAKGLTWDIATSSASWEARDSAASFIFNGKMWTMGGIDGNGKVDSNGVAHYWEAPHFNDIWSTENGVTWKLEKKHAAWNPRRSMSVVYFKDKLWMFGGYSPIDGYTNDIWESTDGIEWTKIVSHAPWIAREGQTAEIFQGKLWMMGGVNYDNRSTKNDVWFSEDGLVWHEATSSAPWSSRWDHGAAIFNGKMYVAGGMDLQHHTFNDVWTTSDGMVWDQVTERAPWETRQGFALVAFKDVLYVIGRLNDKEGGGVNDIWFTLDGDIWQKTEVDPVWIGREDHSAMVFNDKMYVFGGMGADWHWQRDVWVSSQ